MSNLIDFRTKSSDLAIPRDWRWKTNANEFLRPSVMHTRHLHHTLVMIWHHNMPPEAQIRPYYRHYSFGPFYSDEYMKQAISVMARELSTRTDLTKGQRSELAKMARYLNKTSGEIGNIKRLNGAAP